MTGQTSPETETLLSGILGLSAATDNPNALRILFGNGPVTAEHRAAVLEAINCAIGHAQRSDLEHPDCSTAREQELYFALMNLASAVMSRRREWDNWMQGGVRVAPIVRKALRLESPNTSTVGNTDACLTCSGEGSITKFSNVVGEPCPDCNGGK